MENVVNVKQCWRVEFATPPPPSRVTVTRIQDKFEVSGRVQAVLKGTSVSSTEIFQHILHCSIYRLHTCLRFLLLLSLLVVVYQIQPSNVVEHQQHSPLSSNTSEITYIHQMIISLTCCYALPVSSRSNTKKLYFYLILLLKTTFQRVYTSIWYTV